MVSVLRTGPHPASVFTWRLGRSLLGVRMGGPVTISATWPDGSGARTAVRSASSLSEPRVGFLAPSREVGGFTARGHCAPQHTASVCGAGSCCPRAGTRVSLSGPGPQSTSSLPPLFLTASPSTDHPCVAFLPFLTFQSVFIIFFLSPSILKTIN